VGEQQAQDQEQALPPIQKQTKGGLSLNEYDEWFTSGVCDHEDGKGLMASPDGATASQIAARADGWNSADNKANART
jgi:hypothetical protein